MDQIHTVSRAARCDLGTQIAALEEILCQNPVLREILHVAPQLHLPNWYLGAGCIGQTVWNVAHDFDPAKGIKDYDLVYFDATDISADAQNSVIASARRQFRHLPAPIEIVNEARVHLWYEHEFGRKIAAYESAEAAIDEWPTTATGIGVRYESTGEFVVYAPYGLHDLFNLVVRPNKRKITEDIYLGKVMRWTKEWPRLHIVPWHG